MENLLQVTRYGHLSLVKHFTGPPFTPTDAKLLLPAAFLSGDVKTIEYLWRLCAMEDPKILDTLIPGTKMTPLQTAASLDQLWLIDWLLNTAKVGLFAGGKYRVSALYCAAYHGSIRAFNVLHEHMSKKANAETMEQYLGEALHGALLTENREMVELILWLGADVNHPHKGRYPLHLAVERPVGFLKLLLLYHPELNPRNRDRNSPLFHAAYCWQNEHVKLLLNEMYIQRLGIEPDEWDKFQQKGQNLPANLLIQKHVLCLKLIEHLINKCDVLSP